MHSDNPNASHGGMASLYKKSSNGQWKYTRSMYPKSGYIEDRFGQGACAISKDFVIIGDWMNTEQSIGAAHIFKFWGTNEWEHQIKLAPNNQTGIESFGQSVDIYENTAVVGSSDAVFIFELQADKTWKETKKLTPTKKGEGFGQEVAIYGDYLLISAQWEDINGIKNAGAVYVYHKSQNKWTFLKKLTLPEEEMESEAEFGKRLALFENQLLISCPHGKMGEISGAGKAYLYQINQNNISLKQKLFASDFGYNKYGFGEMVDISENFIVISEAQSREHHGSVYVFEKKGTEFVEVDRYISTIESYYGNDFGQAGLAISGNQVFVGAPGDGHCGEEYDACGSAFFYTLKKSNFEEVIAPNKPYVPNGITQTDIDSKMLAYQADSIVFDPINEDGIYLLRSVKTGLWGMYQFEKEIIPMDYDQIDFYKWNSPITFVRKGNKWGVFCGSFSNAPKETVKCKYEELKRFTYQGYLYVAGKKDGKWTWVNWYDGSESGSPKNYHQELQVVSFWNPGNYNSFSLD